MPNNTDTIPTRLGTLRKGLVDQGFSEDQAYQIVLDLIRREGAFGLTED